MLLEKTTYDENDTITLKLASGEELIGKYLSETDSHYKLEKVLMLAMNQKGIGMVPYLITVNPETKLNLSKSAVIVVALSDKEIAGQYIYQTTGIQPVTAGGIVV